MVLPVKLEALLPIWGRCNVRLWSSWIPRVNLLAQPIQAMKVHSKSHKISQDSIDYLELCYLIIKMLLKLINDNRTLTNHIFVVMAVAADGLVPLGDRASADAVMTRFRSRVCS